MTIDIELLMTIAAAVSPFALAGLAAWFRLGTQIATLTESVHGLTRVVEKLDSKQDDHAERIATLEARFRRSSMEARQ